MASKSASARRKRAAWAPWCTTARKAAHWARWTKFLVYNARKRQDGGDRADAYFERTECVAGVQDMRLQELMPDVLHWLGIRRIDQLVSMSNLKYAPIVGSGIAVVERVALPDELITPEASVEMDAKKAAGYFTAAVPDAAELGKAKGRVLDE